MTIQQCRYVLEIAKTGSFNKAAKQLFVAQSSLSMSVKSLEQELKIQIFERSGNGVRLTDDGSEFVKYATQICESSDFVSERYNTSKVKQKLYIVTQHYDFIADIFGKMLSKITDIDEYKFALREIQTYDVIREVEMAYSDIGILAIKDTDYDIMKRYLGKKGLFFTPFLHAKPHVFMRKTHPLAKTEVLNIADLKAYPYVSYEQGEHNSSFFTEEIMNVPVSKHIEISDRATLMNVLLLTDSYTIGTGIMPSALNRKDIVSIPLKSNEFYIIGYILNEDRKISGMLEKFINLLENSVNV